MTKLLAEFYEWKLRSLKKEVDYIEKILKASPESRAIGKDEQGKKDCDTCRFSDDDDTDNCNGCDNNQKWEQSC